MKISNELQELFVAPVKLKKEIEIDGLPLYSSDHLKRKVKMVLMKKKLTKKVAMTFAKMIDDGLLVPCFMNKGIFKLAFFKLFTSKTNKSIAGFYDHRLKKCFILLDNNVNMFGYSSNLLLSKISIHECTHLAFGKNSTGFISINNNALNIFYSEYFRLLLTIKTKNTIIERIVDEILELLYNIETRKQSINNSLFVKYVLLLEKFRDYSELDPEEFSEKTLKYVVCCKIYIKNLSTFINNLNMFRPIIGPLYVAYNNAFKMKNLNTVAVQELLFPSEVMAMKSETRPGSHTYKTLKLIK